MKFRRVDGYEGGMNDDEGVKFVRMGKQANKYLLTQAYSMTG